MTSIISAPSSAATSVNYRIKNEIFQDLPLIDRSARLTVIELRYSDKQIVNELVYRWCKILTREPKRIEGVSQSASEHMPCESSRRVLILDMIASINFIRLKTVLKRSDRRMRMIGLARSCKINSTFITLNAQLKGLAPQSSSLKLIVIYQDEFFILKTLKLLRDCLQNTKCQFLLVVPKLDRQESDVLNLTSNYQLLKCDFCIRRSEIKPAPPSRDNELYQASLNEVYFQRLHPSKILPDRVKGELKESGLFLHEYPQRVKNGQKRVAC